MDTADTLEIKKLVSDAHSAIRQTTVAEANKILKLYGLDGICKGCTCDNSKESKEELEQYRAIARRMLQELGLTAADVIKDDDHSSFYRRSVLTWLYGGSGFGRFCYRPGQFVYDLINALAKIK